MDWRAVALSGLTTMGLVGFIVVGSKYPEVLKPVLGIGLLYGFWFWTYKLFKKD